MSLVGSYGAALLPEHAAIEAWITRLEQHGGHPSFAAMLNAYLNRLPLDTARRVLDPGCGRAVAGRDPGVRRRTAPRFR